MKRFSKSSYLEDTIAVLIQHFGAEAVRAALENAPGNQVKRPAAKHSERPPVLTQTDVAPTIEHDPAFPIEIRDQRESAHTEEDAKLGRLPILDVLESIRKADPSKYNILDEFFMKLKDRKVLPEPLDIQYFAQILGIKDIGGKNRKEMISTLLRFMTERPIDSLVKDVERAGNISGRQRQQGFSILADKLLSDE